MDGNDFSKLKVLSNSDNLSPYDKSEINLMADVVIYSVSEAVKYSELSTLEIQNRIKNLSGGFMGDWNIKEMKTAKEKIFKKIKGVVIKWS
ncbi:MAG: hypothetical protein PHX04_05220 [Bacilli bacterium]|nr:hypothetical protein [Bacilli bacterium]